MTFSKLVGNGTTGIIGVINTVIVPIIGMLIFLVIVWGAVNYFFLHGDDDKKREEGRQFIFWGVLGMAVYFSVWGFVNLALSTLGIAP